MATLTRRNQKAIVFKRVGDERPLFDLLCVPAGIVFTGTGFYLLTIKNWLLMVQRPWLLLDPSWGTGLLVVIGFTLVGIALCVYSFAAILRSERLRVDLRRGTYKCRRGVPFRAEKFRGPIDEFDHIRVAENPYQDINGRFCWAVEFVWRDDRHRPFRVDYWRRARSFRLERGSQPSELILVLRALREISKGMNLPLIPPPKYFDGAELADVENDSWPRGKEQPLALEA
jgi:hypothetical protein